MPMPRKTKIIVAGIGGVGGYFGGLLAKRYSNDIDVQVIFFARHENLKEIRLNGLQVINGKGTITAIPFLATDNPEEIGKADLILICTKSYDLEAVIHQLKPCVSEETIILPLLNGVDGPERIRKMLPTTNVLEGCVYIVSKLIRPGTVENTGNVETLYFGQPGNNNHEMLSIEKIIKDAGIDALLSEQISEIVWEKFIFISPTATATSYFNTNIAKTIEANKETLLQLIKEVKNIAIALGLSVNESIIPNTMAKLTSLPNGVTSSMHRDFMAGKTHTELETLTGYVVRTAQQLGVPAPTYKKLYHQLKEKILSP